MSDLDPMSIGESDAPPIDEKPYKLLFEANLCIGAGKCAAVSETWSLDFDTGIAVPETYFVDESSVAENVDAAEACPAKGGAGVIHVIDRRTGEEIAPDPEGTGEPSLEWSRE
ncbi:ferredoxin [Halococcoides cellulosivorans]|uniref:Ferredoxin n=1 Tax=Halococcoides cellulosivorans TaxID=1679096 RepID=A0A2R4X1T3_9EURY|nr:ferredoxin [Halococcoides cellulosivorans]AWB27760.1 ferredoxin [Halococcoides cellulosivorans]